MRILIAEDDAMTRQGLVEFLESEGYDAIGAADGNEAIQLFHAHRPDMVCLDIMMPSQSGYDVCKRLRAESPSTPILFISAKAEEIDRLVAFDLGADDFVTKPFSVREVLARVRAVARRCFGDQMGEEAEFTIGDLQVLPSQFRARRGEQAIELSPRDVKILQLLVASPGQVLDRQTLFRQAWGEHYFPHSRTLDQHISQLRKRIEIDPRTPKIIQTVHGVGYRYDPIPRGQ